MLTHAEERNMAVQESWNAPYPEVIIPVLRLRNAGGHDWDWNGSVFVPRKCGNRQCKVCGEWR